VPAVTATATEANATVVITPATSLTGDARARTTKVDVTSHDKSAVKNYTVVFTVATGIEDNLGYSLRIYPIPAYEELTLEGLSGVTRIEIFDVTGVKLSAVHCDGESMIKIPVAQLSRGIYFIRLSSPNETIMRRFVKE
jgi:hypothetical protein